MSGFRVSKGGAQELYDIEPDLTTLGKIIGGLPAGAYGEDAEIMDYVITTVQYIKREHSLEIL